MKGKMDALKTALANLFTSPAERPRTPADQQPDDARNLHSAESLEKLAGWVQDLPDDDPRLVTLDGLAQHGDLDFNRRGELSASVLSRYCYGHPQEHPSRLFDMFVQACADEDILDLEEGKGGRRES